MASNLYGAKKMKKVEPKKAKVNQAIKAKSPTERLADTKSTGIKPKAFTSKDGKYKGTKFQVKRYNEQEAAGLDVSRKTKK